MSNLGDDTGGETFMGADEAARAAEPIALALPRRHRSLLARLSGGQRTRGSIKEVAWRFGVTAVAIIAVFGFLSPLILSLTISVKSIDQLSLTSSILPESPKTMQYQGRSLDVYLVPVNGETRELALLKSSTKDNTVTFVDPADPAAAPVVWSGTRFTLKRATFLDPKWDNYVTAWNDSRFGTLLFNTIALATIETIGVLFSCTLVAYSFARFRFPGRNFLFMAVIATIFLPTFATVVPIYTLFTRLGWNGTWLPLIVPTFFANAYDVFLLRQFLMTIPRDLDEAAALDGAGPVRTLVSVILPQAWPAIVAVAIFTFVYSWNDFFGPLLYLSSSPDLQPLSLGLANFNAARALHDPGVVQAATLMTIVVPFVFFLLFQRFFVRGISITGSGVEK
jgi:multiple sugar transport system permease protein